MSTLEQIMAGLWHPVALATLVVAVEGWFARRNEGRHLRWVAGLLCVLLGGLGYLAWNAQVRRETPLHTYILLATVPTIVCAAYFGWTKYREATFIAYFAAAWVICCTTAFVVLFTVFYP